MLRVNKCVPADEASQWIWGPSSTESIRYFTGTIRHQLPIVIVSMALIMALGLLYLFTTPPTYLATASVEIDARRAESFKQQPVSSDNAAVDTQMVQTQIEILKSATISRSVVKKLRLTDDPEFVGAGRGLKGQLTKLISEFLSSAKPSGSELMRMAVATLADHRTVTRDSQTYAVEIGVELLDSNKAAQIANAIVDAYLDDELEAKYAATRRASVWLQQRSKELQAEASAARRAVVEFKVKNNIVDAGGGRLMDDQQLSEVNTQLVLTQAATAEAKARYERIQEVMRQDVPDASVAEALKNEVITKLRGQYLDMAARQAIWSQRYGANHLASVNLRTQMHEILRSIRDEMQKIAESAKSDYEIAQAREQSIRDSLGQAVFRSQTTGQAQIQLQELESASETAKAVRDNFLERYMQAVQQQSFPINEARLIDPAEPPLSKNHPKTFLVLLLTGATGLVVSFCAASLRELSDRVFRSSEQVEDSLRVKCLATLPYLQAGSASSAKARQEARTSLASTAVLKCPQLMLSHVLDEPFSQFTEALRSIKVAINLKGSVESVKVIGLTSTLPHEGKSTVAANYAHLIAQGGCGTILIDADLRNPTLSRQLAPNRRGLIDVIAGRKTIQDVVTVDQRTGLKLVPSGPQSNLLSSNDLLASAAMKNVIDELRESYDYIIIDLPPLIPVVDARAAAAFVDTFIYVIEWGRTRIDTAKHSLAHAPELSERLLGAVINKVDMRKLKRYERYLGNHYYHKYSAQYTRSEHPRQRVRGPAKKLRQ